MEFTTKAKGLCGIKVKGETELEGNFYLSFVYSRNLIMLDGKGNIVWSKHEEQPREGARTGWWDFKKHVFGEKVFYSYHDQPGTYDDYGLVGYGPGERVILDEGFNEVKRLTYEKSAVTEKGAPIDGHDFLMLGPEHYILSGYVKKTVYNVPGYPGGSSVVCSYLQEVKNGRVVWEFDSTDYPELYSLTDADGLEAAKDYANAISDAPDYIHFNSMRVNGRGDLICSFRNINSVVCLDRTRAKDQIRWILSGAGDQFGLSEIQKSSCQHYAVLDGEYITVFDNGNRNRSTRIASYRIDEKTKKLLSFRSYAVGGKYSWACGAAQRLYGETYAIGWGYTNIDADCMSVVDFSTGETLMNVSLDDPADVTYRCVYCP